MSKNRSLIFSFLAVLFLLLLLTGLTPDLSNVTKKQLSDRITIGQANNESIAQIENQSETEIVPLIIDQKHKNSRQSTKLIFVGDIMLSRGVGDKIRERKDNLYPFRLVADYLAKADLTFGNLEGPISELGEDRGHLYSFRAQPETKEGLVSAGFDVLSMANNHAYDYGPQALVDTINQLKENNIQVVGAGANEFFAYQPIIYQINNLKLAILAYTDIEPKIATAKQNQPGVAWISPQIMEKQVKLLKNQVDLIVISLHTGIEYQPEPNYEQKLLSRQLIEWGADVIIGHHPHVRQGYEKYKSGLIFYSLGNFIFDQNWSSQTSLGELVEVEIKDRKIIQVRLIPVKISTDNFQPIVNFDEQKLISNN